MRFISKKKDSHVALTGFWCGVLLIVVMNFLVLMTFVESPSMINTNNGNNEYLTSLLRTGQHSQQQRQNHSTQALDGLLLPPTIWATRKFSNIGSNQAVNITSLMTPEEMNHAMKLCGKFLFSTLHRALHLKNLGQEVFVATGDIDSMWIRDSVVQMSIYLTHIPSNPWLRFVVEGAIRRNAFNILQDPYANAYERHWKDPEPMPLRDLVIGRGGYVATRNYELDSGAYFLNHLYDYFVAESVHGPEHLLQEPMVLEAVNTMIDVWIVEQHHEELSPYRYYELPNEGKGPPSAYTGMTWTGFRPSDDPCVYGYLIPANIHAAAGLQRVLILNDRIWKNDELAKRTSKLLKDIEQGINTHGIVQGDNGELMYAYEVDGLGNVLKNFDDANIPSLLSIPLLGWDGYNREAYENTRKYILSTANPQYFEGSLLVGVGSPHTPSNHIWPMALVIQGLTEKEGSTDREEKMAFQLRQLLKSAINDAMHESVHKDQPSITREWFEWANALFVVYLESTTGASCSASAAEFHRTNFVSSLKAKHADKALSFYQHSSNDPWNPLYYQNVEASIHF